MTKFDKLKTLLIAGAALLTVSAIGAAYTSAQESKDVAVVSIGEKPLDNLGEIAENPKFESSSSEQSLYDDDEKVGETVKIEGITRIDPLGNSNKEFESFEDAQKWAESKKKDNKILSYSIFPIFWSDNLVHSYTVDVVLN